MSNISRKSSKGLRVLISAGEPSGERYGAMLMTAMRELSTQSASADAAARKSNIQFFGLGGEQMIAEGFEAIIPAEKIAVVGIAEVVKHLPEIYREFQKLLAAVDERPPDIAVLIDFPDFNFRLARELYKRGVPVVYFVSPQLWAWRPGRINLVRKYVRKMLVIFPFEEEFYRRHSVEAEFVGHPLAELSPPDVSRADYASAQSLDASRAWIALLPGSRRREIEMNLPEMVRAAQMLGPDFEFLAPAARNIDRRWLESLIPITGPNIRVVTDARAALALSRAAIVASGTATVEAALIGNPFVVVYRVSPLTYALGRRMVTVDHFAMPNLIAGEEVVPELIQQHYSAQNVVEKLQPLIGDTLEREEMMRRLRGVREKLVAGAAGESAATRAARAVFAVLVGRAGI